jgi:hypothetical protein
MTCQEAANHYMCYGISHKLLSVNYLGSSWRLQSHGLGQPQNPFEFSLKTVGYNVTNKSKT